MDHQDTWILAERAKELECLYAVDAVLQNANLTVPAALCELVKVIPVGFTRPEACRISITLESHVCAAPDFACARLLYRAPVMMDDEIVGELAAGCVALEGEDGCELLESEGRLLESIARRISQMALGNRRELSFLWDMLRRIDPDMLLRIGEKLQVHLRDSAGVERDIPSGVLPAREKVYGQSNTPLARQAADTQLMGRRLISWAASLVPRGELVALISQWIQEERELALVKVVDSKDASMADILDAVQKYTGEGAEPRATPSMTETWLVAELSHRFLTSDERLINMVVDNLRVSDFAPMIERVIGSGTSRGNIGGKGAGIFIAEHILKRAAKADPMLADIRTPKTWYLATDQIVDFLHYNNMEDLNHYKYQSAFHLRMTYDGLVAKIKNSRLPPHTVKMLQVALSSFGDSPVIVRSSSLLEDRQSGAFSGKYKSLFLPNTGSFAQRLDALTDAVLEVYSSMYNPDAIQYRRERGLLHFSEQMGVLIQEVVGRRVGRYFLPVFAGVALSHNLLRWSTRITREGGVVRMVMGLGTRAVDRVSDDYPVLFSPEQPKLRVNQTPADIRHYSPKHIDLIDMEKGSFETMDAEEFLRAAGAEFPSLHRYVSVYTDSMMENRGPFSLDVKKDDMVITFDSVLTAGEVPGRIKRMLDVLAQKIGSPVDIEFAHDGEQLVLLQCRPQGSGLEGRPAPIPQNIEPANVLFTANRYISDGLLQGVTHIVYVDGAAYSRLATHEQLLAVGAAVGRLNELLPRRGYILIGPGRWGSRGDIKLGVRVTYSDISGTAALIEVAREKHAYQPELSFGTHFFQDLVEAGIVYVPLYPDQKGVSFREPFFTGGDNLLAELLPQYAWLEDVVHVIDVPKRCLGKTLSLHMNADLEQAVAFLRKPGERESETRTGRGEAAVPSMAREGRDHWQWRHYMASQVAETMDFDAFGVKGVYLFGSTNTGTTGMGSDIDLIIHVEDEGSSPRKSSLLCWLDGWSRALARINYLHTGYQCEHLLDAHLVTDGDIQRGDSFAIKIGSPTDPAAPIRVRA